MTGIMEPINVQFTGLKGFATIRSKVRQFLQTALPNNYFLVEVALNEAVNNAIIHGNKQEEGIVKLTVRKTKRKLIIRVKNEGEGFNANHLLELEKDSVENCFDRRLYDESGRGLPIMDAAFDCMVYNLKGTEVMFMKEQP